MRDGLVKLENSEHAVMMHLTKIRKKLPSTVDALNFVRQRIMLVLLLLFTQVL